MIKFKQNDTTTINNEMSIKFKSQSVNESFARSAIAAFIMQVDPTVEELNDVKTAVSEAVTNCIVHAYDDGEGEIEIKCKIVGEEIHISVYDFGKGIEDIEEAMQPFFTSKAEEERSGMGFTVMETFMDCLKVTNNTPHGTIVLMTKRIGSSSE